MEPFSQKRSHLHIVSDEPLEWVLRMRSLEAERLRPQPGSWAGDRWDGDTGARRRAMAAELGCEDDYERPGATARKDSGVAE